MDVEVRVVTVDERFPEHLAPAEVAEYLAVLKAKAFETPESQELLITADTVVHLANAVLGKPKDPEEASRMLLSLSGKTHHVHTGVCVRTSEITTSFTESTAVTFRDLSEEEIHYYVETYRPMDKAGAYGIQEWIGRIGISSIEGCYYNVMGLPLNRLYGVLNEIKYRD